MTPVLPSTFGTDVVTGITGMITANLPLIVPLIVFGVGFAIVKGFANKAHKGKL